jgi:hypothetical protein
VSRASNVPRDLHVRVGRLVVDAAALPRGTSPRTLLDTLPDRIARRLEHQPADPNTAPDAQRTVDGTIVDAVAARVAPYLSGARERSRE